MFRQMSSYSEKGARKSMSQLVALLHVLNCDVDLVVKKKDVA